jgi:hypothetical protein
MEEATMGQDVLSSGATIADLDAGMDGGPKTKSLAPHATKPMPVARLRKMVCGLNRCITCA